MSFRFYITGDRGLTLTELVVAMGASGILLLVVVSGSLFVQRYIEQWKSGHAVWEELLFVRQELTGTIAGATCVAAYDDSLVIAGAPFDSIRYTWPNGLLRRDGRSLLTAGFAIRRLTVEDFALPDVVERNILGVTDNSGGTDGRLRITVVITSEDDTSDSLEFVVYNEYQMVKFSPRRTSPLAQ